MNRLNTADYLFLKFKSTFIKLEDVSKEYGFKFKNIVGIGAWGFCSFFGDFFEIKSKEYYQIYSIEQINMFRKDLYKLQKIYKELVENNKDILFILRYHPGTIDFEKNEFYGLYQIKILII